MATAANWTLTQDKDGQIQLLKGGKCVDYGYVKSMQNIMKDGKDILCVSFFECSVLMVATLV